MSKKSVLIISGQAPYGSAKPREALDVALTCSIFEMPVRLLFLGDGIYQLLKEQQAEAVEQKSLEAMLSALPMYDIEELYVTADELNSRGLSADQLALPVNVLDSNALSELMRHTDTTLTF